MSAERSPVEAAENKDYLSAMLDWAGADVAQVYIRVTAAAALIALYVSQIPMERLEALDATMTRLLFAGLGSLALAATLYFAYVGKTHNTRRKLARLYVEPVADPEAVVMGVWRRWRWLGFFGGNACFAVGVALLAIVLWQVVTEHVTPAH